MNVDNIPKDLPLWIQEGLKKPAVDFAEKVGQHLARNLSTSQIRNVYGEVKRIQSKEDRSSFETDVLLLKPKLAYARGRAEGKSKQEAMGLLAQILTQAIDAIFHQLPPSTAEATDDYSDKFQRFENFAALFEAILAYHKAEGGK